MHIYLFKSTTNDDEYDDKFVHSLMGANLIPKLIPVLTFEFTNLDILLSEINIMLPHIVVLIAFYINPSLFPTPHILSYPIRVRNGKMV